MIAMDHNPDSVGAELNTSATELQGPKLAVSVRTMQLIAVGLMTGILVFLGVVLVVTQGDIGWDPGLLTLIAAYFGALMIASHF